MAPANSPWTAEMYQRLFSAMSMLITSVILFTITAGVATLFLGLEDIGLLAFTPVVAGGIAIGGLLKARSVFRDLAEKADPSFKVRPSAIMEQQVKEPVATIRSDESALWVEKEREWKANLAVKKKKAPSSSAMKIDWEEWVGKKLLQKAGILIVLVGMLVLLKYSFDNRWIDELGRVVLAVIGAGVLLAAGEYFHKKYDKWAHAFTGGGLALLYLTVWVAHVFYANALATGYGIVVPASLAFVLYSAITFIGAIAAVRYNAQIIAWFTLLGGYLTPLLVNSPVPNYTALLMYLAVLAGGLMLLAWHKKWRHLNMAAFLFTQFYLYTTVYVATPELRDVSQAMVASGFFLLFNILPLLYQFRQKLQADGQDIALIIANGVAVFLPVVDALGGWQSGYVGLVCFALAAFYLLFSAAALRNRGQDDSLVNTYLVGTVFLIAGGLFAELETEWVVIGWAPLSLLLAFIAVRIPRKGVWICSIALLLGALYFLLVNMPVFTAGAEDIWHPFTSNWAIQSYVVFAMMMGWIALSKKLPQKIVNAEHSQQIRTLLHAGLFAILFLGVTFESTQLNFTIDITWTAAYIGLGLLAVGVFFVTESFVWFIGAFIVQILALLFIFAFGSTSGMSVMNMSRVTPFLHPWGYLSLFALIASAVMVYAARIKSGKFLNGMQTAMLIKSVAFAQIWVHVSVEIINMRDAYALSYLFADRVLSAWWIAFALAAFAYAVLKRARTLAVPAMLLLAIPFLHNHVSILSGQERMAETIVWTVLPLIVCIWAARLKWREILTAGMIFLVAAMGIDMLAHLADSTAGLLRSSWWALAGLATMVAGFVEREKQLRQLAMLIFAATVLKLLLVDFSDLATPVRIGASMTTGLLMIGASYLYQRFDTAASKK